MTPVATPRRGVGGGRVAGRGDGDLTPFRDRSLRRVAAWLSLPLLLLVTGCGGGSREANVQLRRERDDLREKVRLLEAEVAGYQAAEDVTGSDAPEPAGLLFVTDKLEFGKLTGGADTDRTTPGDETLRVYVQPVDRYGDELKAAGAFTVTATTDAADPVKLGQWDIAPAEAARQWRNRFSTYGYVLDCPLDEAVDYAGPIVVRVEFTESLTGKTFTAKTDAELE